MKVFSREDRQRYRQKVRTCLDVFARMLSESRFEAEPRSVGLEIELNLTDDAGADAAAAAATPTAAPTRTEILTRGAYDGPVSQPGRRA